MFFYDDISETIDRLIRSQMDESACNSLLYSLFPYEYRLANLGCYDAMEEIVLNGKGNYHITAYDLPYINICTRLFRFESMDEGAYPILFVRLDGSIDELDFCACSLIKIFSCVYTQTPLLVFVSDEHIAFGTVRSENSVEDNFCISDWFLSSDFQGEINFIEGAYSINDIIIWIKSNSKLEKTRREKKKNKQSKFIDSIKDAVWYGPSFEFDLDYIHALFEIESYTGVSTERQRNEYRMMFDVHTEFEYNGTSVSDDKCNEYNKYTYDDIAAEISAVGNISYFEKLDEYSDTLEIREINGNQDKLFDDSETIDFDEYDIPDDILNNPEKLLKYLSTQTTNRILEQVEYHELTDGKDSSSKDNNEITKTHYSNLHESDETDEKLEKSVNRFKLEEGIYSIDNAQLTLDNYIYTNDNQSSSDLLPEEKHLASKSLDNIEMNERIEGVTSCSSNNVSEYNSDPVTMISHFELISLVSVHSETILRYIRDKSIIPDKVVQSGSHSMYYFSPDNVQAIIKKYGWHIISESNKRHTFFQMIERMTMSFSYKPVFIKAFFATVKDGKAPMSKIVSYFRDFYELRRNMGQFVEKSNSIFARSGYSDKEVKKLILVYPYKRFAEMQIFTYSKLFGTVSMDTSIWNSLNSSEILEICKMCDEHIEKYYSRFK